MQLTLTQRHIEVAIRKFVAAAGITFDVDEINFTAGRGKDGLTATVEMADPFSALLDDAASGETPKAKPAKKAEPKPEPVKEEKAAETVEPASEPEAVTDSTSEPEEKEKEKADVSAAFVQEDEAPFDMPKASDKSTLDSAPAKHSRGASLFN